MKKKKGGMATVLYERISTEKKSSEMEKTWNMLWGIWRGKLLLFVILEILNEMLIQKKHKRNEQVYTSSSLARELS